MNTLNILLEDGRYDVALKYALGLLGSDQDNALALKCAGISLLNLGDISGALPYLERASSLLPEDAHICYYQGFCYGVIGNVDKAVSCYERSLQLDPKQYKAHNDLGVIYLDRGMFHNALNNFKQCLRIKPDYPEGYNNLGNLMCMNGQLQQAAFCFHRALELKPDFCQALDSLGAVHRDLGQPRKGLALFAKALILDADYYPAIKNKANMYKQLGEMDKAEEYYARALEINPEYAGGYFEYTGMKRVSADSPFFERLRKMLENPAMTAQGKVLSHFSLGKMYADIDEYDSAFEHYLTGNTIRSGFPGHEYDKTLVERQLEACKHAFSEKFFVDKKGWGSESGVPIFILGMPRSGTTLVEQILASHSQVFGAGELSYVGKMAQAVCDMNDLETFEAKAGAFNSADAGILAEKYLRAIAEPSSGQARITDKMPQNFLHLWLISILFPGAVVLHCRRSPMDTCLSCFFRNFTNPMPFSVHLDSLGHYYNFYISLMEHWRSVLPVRIHDVVYEDMVSSPEAGIRRLLDVCGLDFEGDCLRFYDTRRQVNTASATQVRKGIYTSSVEKWKRYEKHLSPLIEALGSSHESHG